MFNPKQLLQKNRKSKEDSKSLNNDGQNKSQSQSERGVGGYRIERPQDVIRQLQAAKRATTGTTNKKNKQKIAVQNTRPLNLNLPKANQENENQADHNSDHNSDLTARLSQLQQIVAKLTQQLSISDENITQLKRQNSHLETMLLRSEYENAQLRNSNLVSEMKNSHIHNSHIANSHIQPNTTNGNSKNHHPYGTNTNQNQNAHISHVSHAAYLNSERQRSLQKSHQNSRSQQSGQKQTSKKMQSLTNKFEGRIIEEKLQENFSAQVEQILQQIKKEPLETILKKKQYQFRALRATSRQMQMQNVNKYLQKLANLQRQYCETMKKPILVIKFNQEDFEQ